VCVCIYTLNKTLNIPLAKNAGRQFESDIYENKHLVKSMDGRGWILRSRIISE